MSYDEPLEFPNVTAQLLGPVGESDRYAITNVDALGVIERFRFTEVAREVARWAQLFREKGLDPGDRVVVVAERAWEWRCALLGVLRAGGVAVPCPASTPAVELGAIAAHAEAAFLVSVRARPDLVELAGHSALSADELETVDLAEALAQPPHQSAPNDVALILYPRNATHLHGAMHTHASLMAQAEGGEHWLGVREDEAVWCTAADGSAASIWLLFAAWRERANIVVVDLELDPEAQLELFGRLRPAAVWFSDEEYDALASATVPGWIDLGSIRRALVDDESSAGATAFAATFGAEAAPLFGLKELGVVAGWPAGTEGDAAAGTALLVPGLPVAIVDEEGSELPFGQVGDVILRGDARSLFCGYAGARARRRESWFDLGWRGALGADRSLRLVSRSPVELELAEAEVDLPGAEPIDEVELAGTGEAGLSEKAPAEPEGTSRQSKREAKRARRSEERQAKERTKAEDRRRREEEKSRELAERAAAKERKEAERAEREAAEDEARRRAEDEQRREKEQRREEMEARRREEHQAKQRESAEAAERAELEAAEAGKRRRAEEAARAEREAEAKARRREEEDRRRAESEKRGGRRQRREEKQARRHEERLAKEREKAEAAERTQREAAEADERRRAEEAARAEERRLAEEENQREREQRRQENEARRREEQQAKEAGRAQRKAARAGGRRRARKSESENAKPQAGQSEPERLSRDILSRIGQYGMSASPADEDQGQDVDASVESHTPAEPNERGDAD